MQPFDLHPQGPWFGEREPLEIGEDGTFRYPSRKDFDAERIYLNGKLTVARLVMASVDEELPDLDENLRDKLIDAACASWVTKTNMTPMDDGTVSVNLMTPKESGGFQVREDGAIHYWTDEGEDCGDVSATLKGYLRLVVRKVYNFVTEQEPNLFRAVRLMRMMLMDLIDQSVWKKPGQP